MSENEARKHSALLAEYIEVAGATDRLPEVDLYPVLMGLFGEVGSIMAPAKKLHREKGAYRSYQAAVEEEFGDTLWYFSALGRRMGFSLPVLLTEVEGPGAPGSPSPLHMETQSNPPIEPRALEVALLNLGEAAASLLSLKDGQGEPRRLLTAFAHQYLNALSVAKIGLDQVVERNLAKVCGRFIRPDPATLPNFDAQYDEEEQLPAHFEIQIIQRRNGQSSLRWNSVFIGDPLTDNIRNLDGFRFHDVFHFAHAAILHWSPTFRSLIKHKRKSDPETDETQDGGRAIVVEEGLTAWLFTRAKELELFEGQTGVSFDLLKTVHEFVRGYEVEVCPLVLWEDAILQGNAVFRKVLANNGGLVIGNRGSRTLTYKPFTS